MEVYIIKVEDQFENSHIINVCDSEYKAKVFCEKKYGMKIEDWKKYFSSDDLYYDDDDFCVKSNNDKYYDPYYNHFIFSDFEILIREVEY